MQALSLWLDNRIPTPLIHTTTEGDPQPNHPTPAICSTVLQKRTVAKLLNMSPKYRSGTHNSMTLDSMRIPSHLTFFSIRPSCTHSLSVPCLWVTEVRRVKQKLLYNLANSNDRSSPSKLTVAPHIKKLWPIMEHKKSLPCSLPEVQARSPSRLNSEGRRLIFVGLLVRTILRCLPDG
jgi:hypothetical protein